MEDPTLPLLNRRSISILAAACLPFAPIQAHAADDVSAECRGVAAGVVAAMRAAGEVSGEGALEAAVLAARRACSAALQGLSPASADGSEDATAEAASTEPAAEKEKVKLWDLLTEDRERKPGNERLRRLKQ